MPYEIKTIQNISEIENGNTADIAIYNWGGDYRPHAKGILCYVNDQGFAVRMTAAEKNPRATRTEPNSRVCDDSCLEFFVNFRPQAADSGYLNFEGNALGTMLCCYGQPAKPGSKRSPVVDLGYPHPQPRAFRTEDGWGWELLIPLSLIRGIYGSADFHTGDRIRGSFFKCGDKTEHPHYGSFVKIDWPTPNFHRPEFFSDMVITG